MSTVLVADDHVIVREVLCERFRDFGYEVIGEGDSMAQVLELAIDLQPQAVIMDYEMPGEAVPTIRALKGLRPAPALLILTAHEEPEIAALCVRNGADGYLCKTADQVELRTALAKVTGGGKYVSAEHAAFLATQADEESPIGLLSGRELEVLKGLVDGRTVTEISGSLGLSSKTVSTYRARVFEKLDCRNMSDVMRLTLREGLWSEQSETRPRPAPR